MPGCTVVAFLEAVSEGLPVVVGSCGRGFPGVIVSPATFGKEFVFVDVMTGVRLRGRGRGEVVAELSSE